MVPFGMCLFIGSWRGRPSSNASAESRIAADLLVTEISRYSAIYE